MKAWVKISYSWVFCGGRSYIKSLFNQCDCLDSLKVERDRIYKTIICNHPEHWAAKQFENMYHERMMELFYDNKR